MGSVLGIEWLVGWDGGGVDLHETDMELRVGKVPSMRMTQEWGMPDAPSVASQSFAPHQPPGH